MKQETKERGITLIALVITIIILLILAGVTISIVMNDGLLEKSQNAVDKYSYEQEKEEEMLSELDKYFNNYKVPIYTAEQLKKVGSGETVKVSENEEYTFNIDANYVLMSDIELNEGKYSIQNGEITFDEDAEQWTPIGTEENPFIGNFNGNGHTISGLYINSTSDNQGLFGVIESGTIEKLGVSGKIICNSNQVGGIVGYITGYKNVKINNCYNLSNISIKGRRVGGIIGYNDNINTTINNCYNKGNIKCEENTVASYDMVGGICGHAGVATISHCYNEGKIEGVKRGIGGIVGEINSGGTSDKGLIEYCYNIGEVDGGSCVGGILGSVNNGIVSFCYNSGKITCYGIEKATNVGGIVGYHYNALINSCYNKGNVEITDGTWLYAGGISGFINEGSIENCYNIGTINMLNKYGSGILGVIDSNVVNTSMIIVSNCYYLTGKALGGINGADEIGKAEARTEEQMKTSDFVTILNNGEDNWTIVSSKNEGYPILKWQK